MIMVPLKLIKSKSSMKMKHDKIDISIFQMKCLKHHFKLKRLKVNKTRVLMNSKTGKMSSIALKLNFKFNLT